ncbi:MAG: shikimate kinase [Muribaculaceae bacterium]|nr:shikimate kinase [Muribaculaceae bacterium]
MSTFVAMKPVFLIGYMGCGKTTLGEPLARFMGRRFVDLDAYIEEKHSMTAKEIFSTYGEAHFRQLEREALEEVAACCDGAIVACGGGTPLQDVNMELMNRVGITVWLCTSVERITSRLVLPEQRTKRPLLNDMTDSQIRASVAKGLEERTPYYQKAQLRFDSTLLESVEQVECTAVRLREMLNNLLVD